MNQPRIHAVSTRIIYKYPVKYEGVIVQGHSQRVVLVGFDPKLDEVCVWVELELPVDSLDARVQYLIQGTGFHMEDVESYHVGSCIVPDGHVWHVYGKRLGRG